MKVTTFTALPHEGVLHKMSEDEASMIPFHINFTVEDGPWMLEGVIFTDIDTEEKIPEVIQFTVRRKPGGPRIEDDMLRGISIAKAKKAALDQVAVPWKRIGSQFVRQASGAVHPLTVNRALARKGRRATEDDIRSAADAYRSAITAGRSDVLVAVGEAIHASTATAGRRIKRARELAMIGAGE